MDDNIEKVYTPTVIEDQPFPLDAPIETSSTQSTAKETYSAEQIKDMDFPRKNTAIELLSSSLNTKNKKILQEYQFTESGALQIGKYINGVSGDLRISPAGITARNKAGITTFALDGETGDATFVGTVRSGSVISGDLILGGADNEDGVLDIRDATNNTRVYADKEGITVYNGKIQVYNASGSSILDASGLVGANNFTTAQAGKTDSTVTSTTSTSLVDIADTTNVAFNITRTRMILVIFTAEFAFMDADGGFDAYIHIGGDVNDVQEPRISLKGSVHRATGSGDYVTLTTYAFRSITANSPPTSYTIKARWQVSAGVTAYCRNRQLSYYLLGN